MKAEAYAKINLTLRVDPPGSNRLHPIRSIAQTIDWADLVELECHEPESFVVEGADLTAGADNLAVRALQAVRTAAGRSHSVAMRLVKRIPVAAGLGGGSSDAATVLALASECLRLDPRARNTLAPGLGADVALFLWGGLVRMEGHGEEVRRLPEQPTLHPAVVVPPFELATADVYRRWDELGGPRGASSIAVRHLPPSLRSYGPLVNDLTPAALDLVPDLGDWMSDLARRWSVPVAMSGSGPSVFGLFATRGEADDAAAAVADGTRGARGCSRTPGGHRRLDDEAG